MFQVVKILAFRLSLFLLVALLSGLTSPVSGQAAEELELRALPLLEPCRPLAEGGRLVDSALVEIRDESPLRRSRAIVQLARLCHRAGFEAILKALSDRDPEVRIAAVEALGTLRDPRTATPSGTAEESVLEPLIGLAQDPDWRVRFALTRTLASFQVYQASNTVLNLIANPGGQKIGDERDLRVRCQAILMINQLRDVRFSRKSIGFLATFADYPEPPLRAIAEATVAELEKTRNGYHELVGIAKKPGAPQLRIRAIEWLARWKREQIRPLIEEIAASESNPRVREAALRTLETLLK